MSLSIKVKINNKEEGIIQSEDIVDFTVARSITDTVSELTLQINNVEKYLKLFLNKIIFFQITVIFNNYMYDFETYYPYKSELKGSKIILTSNNIQVNLAQKSYNRVFSNQSLQTILDTVADEMGFSQSLLDHKLKNVQIDGLHQNNKTNLDILKELCEIFYSYTYITNNRLLFLKTADFNLDTFNSTGIILNNNQIISIKTVDSEYKLYKGVKCLYFDKSIKDNRRLSLGISPYLEIQSNYNKTLSQHLVKSKYLAIAEKELLEAVIVLSLHLNIEHYIAILENTVGYQQFKGFYFVKEIQHRYDGHNFRTHILAYKVQ